MQREGSAAGAWREAGGGLASTSTNSSAAVQRCLAPSVGVHTPRTCCGDSCPACIWRCMSWAATCSHNHEPRLSVVEHCTVTGMQPRADIRH